MEKLWALFLVGAFVTEIMGQSCPLSCLCSMASGEFIVRCVSLYSIPDDIPTYIHTLIVNNSNIQTLYRDNFRNYASLRELYIEHSGVQRIERGAFNGLQNLQTLSLSHNPILNLQENGDNIGLMTGLHTFKLNGCAQKSLTATMFSSMPQVQIVELKNNMINQIVPNVFGGYVSEIYFDGNPLNDLGRDAFQNLNSLQSLSFVKCNIGFIDGTVFTDKKIQILNFSGNQLRHNMIPTETFAALQFYLQKLDLSGNPLEQVNPNQFEDLVRLEELNLASIQIDTFPSDLLPKLPNLQNLDLSNNKLRYINKSILEHIRKKQISINLCGNPWNCDINIKDLRDWLSYEDVKVLEKDACFKCYESLQGQNIVELGDATLAGGALDTGALIGIIVGAIVLVIVLIILGVCLWRYCRQPEFPREVTEKDIRDNNVFANPAALGDDGLPIRHNEINKSRNRPQTARNEAVFSNAAAVGDDGLPIPQSGVSRHKRSQPRDGQMIIMNPGALEMDYDDAYKKHGSALPYQIGQNRDIVSDEPTVFSNPGFSNNEKINGRVVDTRHAVPYQATDETAVIENKALTDVNIQKAQPKETML